MRSMRVHRKYLTLLFYGGVLCFVLTSVAFAQVGPDSTSGNVAGAGTILENAVEVSKQSTEGINELWDMTFTGTYSPTYLSTVDFARKVMVIPFFWLFIPISRAFVFNRYEEMFKHVAWLVLVMVLAVNNFGLTAKISYGVRGFINDSTHSILEQQVGRVSMQDALRDAILTETAKDEIRATFIECEAKEGEAQLECFNEGAKKAKEKLEAIERNPGFFGWRDAGRGLRRLHQRLDRLIAATDTDLSTGNPYDKLAKVSLNFVFQTAGQALAQQLMKGFQNAMLIMMEVGFFLTALLGPVAVATTLAPLQPRSLMIWGAALVSFGMMKMSYNILVGAIASVALLMDAGDFGSIGLLIAMAVVSPVLAMGMAAWGGARLVQAMAGAATIGVSMIHLPSIPSGGKS